jgi:hypothetical protein
MMTGLTVLGMALVVGLAVLARYAYQRAADER